MQMSDDNKPTSGFQFGLANLKAVESDQVAVTFPDGAKREFPKGTPGL
jgi:threonyl-tRNA synthetase